MIPWKLENESSSSKQSDNQNRNNGPITIEVNVRNGINTPAHNENHNMKGNSTNASENASRRLRSNSSSRNDDQCINAPPHSPNDWFFLQLHSYRESLHKMFPLGSSQHWQVLLLGQILSLFLALTGAASTTLSRDCELSAPTAQSGLGYVVLSLHLVFIWWKRKRRGSGKSLFCNGSVHRETSEECKESNNLLEKFIQSKSGAADADYSCPKNSNGKLRHPFDEDSNTIESNDPPSPWISGKTLPFTNMPLKISWWVYLVIAFLDVEANFLTVLSFRYTSFTSISLLDSLAIPSAMFSSRLLLGRTYSSRHLLGVLVCLVGLTSAVLSDCIKITAENGDGGDHKQDSSASSLVPHSILGDMIAIAGSSLYGMNDTLAEFSVKNFDRMEYLGMLGLFGTIISAIQSMTLERDEMFKFFETSTSSSCEVTWKLALLGLYVVALVVFYIGVSYFLVVSDAALLILSLLTSNLWAVLFSIIAQKIVPSLMFFVALIIVIVGVIIYETAFMSSSNMDPIKLTNSVSSSEEEPNRPDASLEVSKGAASDYGSIIQDEN